jgi:hypothetical protein
MRNTYIATIAGILALAATTSCASNIPPLPPSHVAEPAASDIESVVFMMGDAGEAHRDTDPVLRVMELDVEKWSGSIPRDSSVVVLFLGDNVYPAGLHDRSDPLFEADSTALQSQIDIVNGPNARQKGVRGIFIAGNHDWGQTKGLDGLVRLKNQEEMLKRRREQGTPVALMPPAGTPGPQTIDVGTRLRILLLDSAWWLLTGQDTSKTLVSHEMKRAIETAGKREVLIAEHHPFLSASSHGGLMPFWSGLGLRYMLNRSGAVLQDLSSLPYRSLTRAYQAAFEGHPPLLFAGGHDHNLQVIQGQGSDEPKWMVVSGAGSKQDDVGAIKGMKFRHAASGYMRMMVYKNGHVDLFVIASPGDKTPECHEVDLTAREQCMVATSAAFTDVYSLRLK